MRQRMTWGRKASAHPAYPDEGPASPAYPGADPEADAYENGDPSSWAEDPRKGPYAQGAHPSYPDEGPASPAYNKQATLERKAAKCIRIASAMLGRTASVRQIEDQALVLMDLDNRAITATLSRLAGEEAEDEEAEDEAPKAESKKKASVKSRLARLRRLAAECEACGEYEDEELLLEEMLAEEELMDEPEFMGEQMMLESMLKTEHMGKYARFSRRAGEEAEDEEAEEEAPKAESKKKASVKSRLARLRRLAAEADAEEEAEDEVEAPKAESKKKAAWGEYEQDLLESMMAEEGISGEFEDEIAESEDDLLESMMAEEGIMPEAEADHMAESEDEVLESMLGDDFGGSEDPMGVVDVDMTPDERFLMAKLFGGKKAGEEEAEDEAPEAPKAEKKASFRPQPRKPANGVTRLGGGVTKEASASNDLSKLWDSAPDVSKYF